MNDDNIYWLFSASAQSIAAFVAFLLTGYALVHNLMESARSEDPSLDEIQYALRLQYHKQLSFLCWATGLAIALSLAMVFTNRWSYCGKLQLVALVAVVNLAVLVLAVAFVIEIVDPRKYQKMAKDVLRQSAVDLKLTQETTSSWDFFDAFRKLEAKLRGLAHRVDPEFEYRNPRYTSYRQMVETLLRQELISRGLYDELNQLGKYRNLVFHAHIQEADPSMVERAKRAARQLDDIAANWAVQPARSP